MIYEAKRSMIGSLLMCIAGAILWGMLSLMLLGASHTTATARIILGGFFSIWFIACAFFFVRALFKMLKAKRGEFTVVEDVLTEIKDNQLSLMQLIIYGGRHTLFGNKAHLNHIFHFQSGKIFIANVEEYKNTRLGATAEFSLPGDSFYLAFYNDSPNKIVLLFSSKTYSYKENE